MVSRTRVTKTRRQNKAKVMGRDRKKKTANKGSTPKFPIHLEGTKEKK